MNNQSLQQTTSVTSQLQPRLHGLSGVHRYMFLASSFSLQHLLGSQTHLGGFWLGSGFWLQVQIPTRMLDLGDRSSFSRQGYRQVKQQFPKPHAGLWSTKPGPEVQNQGGTQAKGQQQGRYFQLCVCKLGSLAACYPSPKASIPCRKLLQVKGSFFPKTRGESQLVFIILTTLLPSRDLILTPYPNPKIKFSPKSKTKEPISWPLCPTAWLVLGTPPQHLQKISYASLQLHCTRIPC